MSCGKKAWPTHVFGIKKQGTRWTKSRITSNLRLGRWYLTNCSIYIPGGNRMKIVCLDLEGVLVPEIWIAFSKKTGIEELRLTTRDIPDYTVLMNKRIGILKEHKLTLGDIQSVIATMDPLPGAMEFLDWLRSETQIVILSDTFSQFAKPLMKKLAWPTLLCNELIIDENNMISGFSLRQSDGKRKAVEGFTGMGCTVFAAGDSYNDLTMIRKAESGAFFCPPESIVRENPDIPVALDYESLKSLITAFLSR